MRNRSRICRGEGPLSVLLSFRTISAPSPLFLLLLLALIPLPGCGVMDYFTGEEATEKVSSSTMRVPPPRAHVDDGIDEDSTLLDLERFLLDRSPALDRLRTEIAELDLGEADAGWIPGSVVSDSSQVGPRDSASRSRERSLSIDWRPANVMEADLRQKTKRSRSKVAIAKLREAESKLLRLLREEWSELWFQRQVVTATTTALDALQRVQESALDSASATMPILIDSLRTRWNDRVEGIAQEAVKTRVRINSLLGRPEQALLPLSSEPGDVRFEHIDQLTDRRLHPREIIAHEQLSLASVQLEETDTGGWPDIVVAAQSHDDVEAPVTGSTGNADSWTFTVGVEFPLGRQGRASQRRAARSQFGSARALQVMARRSIEDEIAAARAQLIASVQRLEEIENEVIPSIKEVRTTLPTASLDRVEARLRVDDGLLEAQLARSRALADRARARFSLIDLLGLEKPQPASTYSRAVSP